MVAGDTVYALGDHVRVATGSGTDSLADDISARRYSKAEHRRALLPLLNDRSERSVEFKHQNISAVLKGLGED